MSLLRAQIKKEEQLLKQDQAEVDQLEHSLKSNEILRREQSRTSHPIARKLGQEQYVDLLALDSENKKVPESSITELFQDEEMSSTLQQLQNHLDSMRNNTKDLSDVKKVVKQAAIESDVYAFSNLDGDKYRQAAGLAAAYPA